MLEQMIDKTMAPVDFSKTSVVESVDYPNNAMVILVGERKLRIAATIENVEKIENLIGCGFWKKIVQYASGDFRVGEMAKILYHAIEDKKDTRFNSAAELGQAILKEKKLNEYLIATIGFLFVAYSDGTPLGKPEAAPEPETAKE